MRIVKKLIGIPEQEATELIVHINGFSTEDKTAQLYWQVKSKERVKLAEGYVSLTEEEFTSWGFDNTYVEDLVLTKLNLVRSLEEPEEETEEEPAPEGYPSPEE